MPIFLVRYVKGARYDISSLSNGFNIWSWNQLPLFSQLLHSNQDVVKERIALARA